MSSFWTCEKDRDLAGRYATGDSVAQIAADFDCTIGMVRTRVATLGLLRRALRAGQKPAGGNAAWVVGEALRGGLAVPKDPFADDLLNRLDQP